MRRLALLSGLLLLVLPAALVMERHAARTIPVVPQPLHAVISRRKQALSPGGVLHCYLSEEEGDSGCAVREVGVVRFIARADRPEEGPVIALCHRYQPVSCSRSSFDKTFLPRSPVNLEQIQAYPCSSGDDVGYPVPGYMNPVGGRGFGFFGRGRGRGGGWGRRNWFYATGLTGWQRAGLGMGAYGAPPVYPAPYPAPYAAELTREQELDALKNQAEYFADALGDIKKRIEDIEAEQKSATKDKAK